MALRLFAGPARKDNFKPILLRRISIDGLPGYVSIDREEIMRTTALDMRDNRIAAIYIVRNTEKLRHVAGMLGDMASTPRQ